MATSWDARPLAEHQRVEGLLLKEWLPAAVSFSSYWSSRAANLGFGPDDVATRADLRRFPVVRERDVVGVGGEGSPALLMRPTEAQAKARASSRTVFAMAKRLGRLEREHKRFALLEQFKPVHVHRAGRTDELAVAYTRSDLERLHRCGARAARVLGLSDADYLISAVPAGPSLDFWGVYHLALGSSMLALHPRGHGDSLSRMSAGAFKMVPATCVAVRVEEAVSLATLLRRDDATLDRVRTVIVVGPPPTDDQRGEIAQAWAGAGASPAVKVLALYAPNESRALWAESADGTPGLVTYPDHEVLEVVDPVTGAVVSDGGGDLTISSAGWHGTALLRYQTGVYVERIEASTSGMTAPRIVGRVRPQVWQPRVSVREGTYALDFRGAPAVFAGRSDIRAWRVEIPARGHRGHDQVLVEVAGELHADAARELDQLLTTALGVPITQIVVMDRPEVVAGRIEEVGSVFADLR